MNKQEFLAQLSSRLEGLPKADRTEALSYWSEIIDDRMEDGTSEEDAIAAIGTPAQISAQILGETMPLGRSEAKKEQKAWMIVLLILGAPIWLSLLIAAAAVILSVYVSVWASILALWAVAVSVSVSALPLLAYGIFGIVSQGAGFGLFQIGAALGFAGIGLFLTALCIPITKGICIVTVRFFRLIKQHKRKENRV